MQTCRVREVGILLAESSVGAAWNLATKKNESVTTAALSVGTSAVNQRLKANAENAVLGQIKTEIEKADKKLAKVEMNWEIS